MVAILQGLFLPAFDVVSPSQDETFPQIRMPDQDKGLLVIKYVDSVGLWFASPGGCYYRGKP
jgi:hypothetical protein